MRSGYFLLQKKAPLGIGGGVDGTIFYEEVEKLFRRPGRSCKTGENTYFGLCYTWLVEFG